MTEPLNLTHLRSLVAVVDRSSFTRAAQVLPRLLGAFRETFPGHELSFMLQRSTALIESVRREELDLAVTLAITPDAPGTRVGAVRLRWVANHALEITGGCTVLPLVAFEDPCAIRARAFDLLGASGTVASVVAQSASLDGVLSAARAGLGLALLPIASGIPEGLREVPGLPSAGWIGVHLVSREGLAETITHTAATMLSSFLSTTTETARTPIVPAWHFG